MKPRTAKHLHDAIAACDELRLYTAEWSEDEFLATRSLQLIVWKLVEIVEDALHEARESEPMLGLSIPGMSETTGLMRLAATRCRAGDASLLWEVAMYHLPALRQEMAVAKRDALPISA